AARLGAGVRARQQSRPALGAAPDDIADAADPRLQPRLLHAAGEPAPAFDVLRRQVRAMHAGLVAAELGDAAQVAEQALTVDLGHGVGPREGEASRLARKERAKCVPPWLACEEDRRPP